MVSISVIVCIAVFLLNSPALSSWRQISLDSTRNRVRLGMTSSMMMWNFTLPGVFSYWNRLVLENGLLTMVFVNESQVQPGHFSTDYYQYIYHVDPDTGEIMRQAQLSHVVSPETPEIVGGLLYENFFLFRDVNGAFSLLGFSTDTRLGWELVEEGYLDKIVIDRKGRAIVAHYQNSKDGSPSYVLQSFVLDKVLPTKPLWQSDPISVVDFGDSIDLVLVEDPSGDTVCVVAAAPKKGKRKDLRGGGGGGGEEEVFPVLYRVDTDTGTIQSTQLDFSVDDSNHYTQISAAATGNGPQNLYFALEGQLRNGSNVFRILAFPKQNKNNNNGKEKVWELQFVLPNANCARNSPVIVSPDGLNLYMTYVCEGNSNLMVISAKTGSLIRAGKLFAKATDPQNCFDVLVLGNSRYVVSCNDKLLVFESDGSLWKEITSPDLGDLYSSAWPVADGSNNLYYCYEMKSESRNDELLLNDFGMEKRKQKNAWEGHTACVKTNLN